MDQFDEYRDWKAWENEEFGAYDAIEAIAIAAEFAKVGVAVRAKPRLLEIGCGNGNVAGWARTRGWQYVGTELDPELVARARKAGFAVHAADVAIDEIAREKGAFDIVAAFDVIEHLETDAIVTLLRQARRCLKQEGIFVARFPSGDSPFSCVIQNGDITHRSVIGSGMVHQLALRTGFRVEQIRAPVLPILGVGIRRALRRSALKCCRTAIGGLVRLVYFDNQPRVIDPNMLIVLRPDAAAVD